MLYNRITEGLSDRGKLIPFNEDPFKWVNNPAKDYYLSTFLYTEEQKNIFLETGTIAGITDLVCKKLWWDFDCEEEPGRAQEDAKELVARLKKQGIDPEDVVIAFSGNKGFGIELNVRQTLLPKEAKTIAFTLAADLPTFDVKMYNASRILRLIGTRHQKSLLYKTPLTFKELVECSIDAIMTMAKNPSDASSEKFRWGHVVLPSSLFAKQETKEQEAINEGTPFLDYSAKPKFLSNCRWALQNGHFKQGDRSTALLCLASTYKNLGFDVEHVYRLLKGTAELQARQTNTERFPDEQIYNNIVTQVYSDSWKNGQYTCREKNNWLQIFCSSLSHPCNHAEEDGNKPKTLFDIKDSFKEYVTNIEKNVIKTGLPSIDENLFISTGAVIGIIGSAGSGKTSLALNILNNTSKSGVKSVFASLDMHKNRMFEKVMYKISSMTRKPLYDVFKNNEEAPLMDKLKQEFGNVFFYNKSCPSVSDIRDYILACQDKSGEKIKFVMLDYFERVFSDIGDETSASKRVAGELQDMVNDLDVAVINLVQPNKHALLGGPESPLYEYTSIKGSSYLYQSMRIILSLWRPYYNPKTIVNDKFMQIAVLKNDLGELGEWVFNWDGQKGEIGEMDKYDQDLFYANLKAQKEQPKSVLNFIP